MNSLIQRALARIRNEPVLLLTGLIIGATAFQDAVQTGLTLDDAALAVAQALAGFAMREFVFSRGTHDEDVAAAFAEGQRVGASPNRNTL